MLLLYFIWYSKCAALYIAILHTKNENTYRKQIRKYMQFAYVKYFPVLYVCRWKMLISFYCQNRRSLIKRVCYSILFKEAVYWHCRIEVGILQSFSADDIKIGVGYIRSVCGQFKIISSRIESVFDRLAVISSRNELVFDRLPLTSGRNTLISDRFASRI